MDVVGGVPKTKYDLYVYLFLLAHTRLGSGCCREAEQFF